MKKVILLFAIVALMSSCKQSTVTEVIKQKSHDLVDFDSLKFKGYGAAFPGYIVDGAQSDTTYKWYFYYATSKYVMSCKDSTYMRFYTNHLYFDSLKNRDNGTPTSLLWLASDGEVKRSPMSGLTTALSSSFKAASYTPSNSEVITALGITPINIAGARSAVSLTTAGTSGASTYNSGTGVLNIPQYTVPALSFDNAPTRSFVTTAAAANGFQLSSTRPTIVNYSVVATVTALLNGYIILEISPTNSTSAASWGEVSRAVNGNIGAVIPAGYYARLRSVTLLGLPTYTYNSGQEVLFN